MITECLIISKRADEYAAEIARLSHDELVTTVCKTAQEALAGYSGQSIVFGDPDRVAEALPGMPNVAWVQSTWAGIRPFVQAERRDYILTGVKDVFGAHMAEYVLGHLLAYELKILERAKMQARHHWHDAANGTLSGKTLGILGTGSIGQSIARAAAAFDVRIIGLNRSGKPVEHLDSVLSVQDLRLFLAALDYVVATLPDTPETDELMNAQAFAQLPAGAYFINVGRSNVVNDMALTAALESGHLAGAVLDVFKEEPLPLEHPFWRTSNLLITAHTAAASHAAAVVPIFIDNLRRYERKQELQYVVDFENGY